MGPEDIFSAFLMGAFITAIIAFLLVARGSPDIRPPEVNETKFSNIPTINPPGASVRPSVGPPGRIPESGLALESQKRMSEELEKLRKTVEGMSGQLQSRPLQNPLPMGNWLSSSPLANYSMGLPPPATAFQQPQYIQQLPSVYPPMPPPGVFSISPPLSQPPPPPLSQPPLGQIPSGQPPPPPPPPPQGLPYPQSPPQMPPPPPMAPVAPPPQPFITSPYPYSGPTIFASPQTMQSYPGPFTRIPPPAPPQPVPTEVRPETTTYDIPHQYYNESSRPSRIPGSPSPPIVIRRHRPRAHRREEERRNSSSLPSLPSDSDISSNSRHRPGRSGIRRSERREDDGNMTDNSMFGGPPWRRAWNMKKDTERQSNSTLPDL
jgi:hypothetical protein